MRAARALITIAILSLLLGFYPALALDRSLDVSQYGHTAWTARDGFAVGAIFAMAQRPMGICGSAPNSVCSASMDFTLSPGNHRRGSNFPTRLTPCS